MVLQSYDQRKSEGGKKELFERQSEVQGISRAFSKAAQLIDPKTWQCVNAPQAQQTITHY